MPSCPRCGGYLYLDNADSDGERYWRCVNCARVFGMKAGSRRRESASLPVRQPTR